MDPALEGLGDVLLGSLLAVLGLATLTISLYRRKGVDPLLASFGIFALLYGVRLVVGNPMTAALGVSSLTAAWIRSLTTYLILAPAWFFFWKLLGDGWCSLVLWWLRVVTVFAIVGVASDLIQGTPGTLTRHPNNVIVLLGLVAAVLGSRDYWGRMTTDLRILMTGLSIFGLLAINDNLVSMGVLPWTWQKESLGFLVFVGSLGWIAARRFIGTERELATVAGEIESAKKIQSSILPASAPSIEGVEIGYRLRPSSSVAGDFFEFLELGPHHLGIVVADVSGHGIPAALIASMLKVAVQSESGRADCPAELLRQVNETLCGSFSHGFVTAACVFLNAQDREAKIASGGHPFPVLRRRGDAVVREVGGKGVILGRFPDGVFEEERITLEPGDRLVLFTDGIVEARSTDGEQFGEDRLFELVSRSGDLTADSLCESLLDAIERWAGGNSLEDDVTLVVVDYRPTAATEA